MGVKYVEWRQHSLDLKGGNWVGFWLLFVLVQLLSVPTPQPYGLQHATLLCPPLSPTVCSNSSPWSQ